MTRFDPCIRLNRMIVQRGARAVYDEFFHAGLNIVRGENSSGKSTVLNFIHYGLGGDVHEWSETALLCDRVTLEVVLSGKAVTISRALSEDSMQGMDFFFGNLESSASADQTRWERHPYRRSQSKESFSQVMFRLLEMPEAANEDSGNITMHQVLRLLYGDQLSPIDEIFAHEGFDNPKIRDALGRLLCGAFDNELYSNELKIRQFSKKYDEVAAELSSLFRALGASGHDLTEGWVSEQRARIELARVAAESEIDRLKTAVTTNSSAPTLEAQETAYMDLVGTQQRLAKKRTARDSLELEFEDSSAFIASLDKKLIALKDSALVASVVGTAQFTLCPACYRELSQISDGHCGLCKEALDSGEVAERLGGLINETALQLRQSRLLQEDRLAHLETTNAELDALENDWRTSARRYAEIQQRPTSEQELLLERQYKTLGYLQRREEDLVEKAKIIEMITKLSNEKVSLTSTISELRTRNEQLTYAQERRLQDAYYTVAENTRRLLTRDLKRQDSFEDPKKVDFSFSENKISVDGHSYFSASSRAFLKSAFLFGFHMSAAEKSFFRHPRFLMLDTIEDKGMEATRSQNFQLLVAEIVGTLQAENQVIIGTAMIAGELNVPAYTVGRFYTRDDRSLALS